MKVYKLEVYVMDVYDEGEKTIVQCIEDSDYFSCYVKDVKSVDAGEWSDDHPLNRIETSAKELEKLFILD